MLSVTDTSAASTPTNAQTQPPAPSSLEYSSSHPLSALSSSHSAMADSPTNASSAVGAGSASTYAPVRRSKDKQKHSESENRRRMRLRAKFNALKDAAQCNKKDRFNILQGAVNRLQEQEERIAQLEASLGSAAPTPNAASSSSAAAVPPAAAAASTTLLPSLSTPLSNYQMLSALACCYISLDGRILDANAAFLKLFGFTPSAAAGGGSNSGASTPASSVGGAEVVPRADDIYSSSIFALTHHAELIHTLSILRNLLCGVMDCFECTKRCVTMGGGGSSGAGSGSAEMTAADASLGRQIECAMTITSVKNAGRIVMFLVIFVPRSPPASASGGVTPNAQSNSISSSGSYLDVPMSVHSSMPTPTTPSMLLPSPQAYAPSLPLTTHGQGQVHASSSTLPLHRPPRGVPHQPYARHHPYALPSPSQPLVGISHMPPSTPSTNASMLSALSNSPGGGGGGGFSLPSAADLGGRLTSSMMSAVPPPPTPLQIQPSTLHSAAATTASANALANAAANSFLTLSSPGVGSASQPPSASPPLHPSSSAAPPPQPPQQQMTMPEMPPMERLTSLASIASGEAVH